MHPTGNFLYDYACILFYCLTNGGPFQLGICSDIPESWSPELSPPLPPGDIESPAPSMDGNSQDAELTTATGRPWEQIHIVNKHSAFEPVFILRHSCVCVCVCVCIVSQ